MTATLVCSGLRKSFGDRVAVDDVEFSIAAGETYGLLGPNGAGKTTTISMVCGLLTRDAGEILLEGRPFDTTSIDAKAAYADTAYAEAQSAPNTDDKLEQLRELGELRSSGVLTQAEFEVQKAKILSG